MAFTKKRTTSRKKVCPYCKSKVKYIDYKDPQSFKSSVTQSNGKITPRRVSGACAKHQRMASAAIKRARQMALIPYVAE